MFKPFVALGGLPCYKYLLTTNSLFILPASVQHLRWLSDNLTVATIVRRQVVTARNSL